MTSKVIIVTGASRGIGLAVSNFLLTKNANVIVVARTADSLRQIQQQHPERVKILAQDLSELSLGKDVVDLAINTWGRLDGLVINHGVLAPVETVANSSAEEWRDAFNVNFFSAISLVQAALPALRKSQGRIIFTSSGAAASAYQGWGAYGASKAAINHLAMTLAAEERSITSIALRPGVVDTEMQREIREVHHQSMHQKDAAKFAQLKAGGQLLKPEQPGNVIAKLVLEAPIELSGRFITWDDKDLANFQD